MIDGVRLKVCGLTSLVDAELADRVGADYLGFILHPSSPRHLSLLAYRSMHLRLPAGRKRVAVMVEPSDEQLEAAQQEDFDRFQLHFRSDTPLETLTRWSERVMPSRLWLAPRLAPGEPFRPEWLPLAGTFLIDTYRPDGFGGSGRVGDWPRFAELQRAYPDHTWVLAGGLNPDNIADALTESRARAVDVNSGVEASAGLKDHAKMKSFVVALHRARTAPPAET